jgi:hypothetical protein
MGGGWDAAGGGASELIVNSGDAMEGKVVRQLGRAMQPLLTNVTVNWGPLTPLLKFPAAPVHSKPLYAGCRAVVFAVLDGSKGPAPAGGTVCVTAVGPDGPVSWGLNLSLDGEGSGSSAVDAPAAGGGGGVVVGAMHRCSGRLVHTAAARARIRDLEVEGEGGRNEAVSLAVRCVDRGGGKGWWQGMVARDGGKGWWQGMVARGVDSVLVHSGCAQPCCHVARSPCPT